MQYSVSNPCTHAARDGASTRQKPVGVRVARFPTAASLPHYSGRSAPRYHFFEAYSLALRSAWSLNCPRRPLSSKCSDRCRCPIVRSRLERQLPGRSTRLLAPCRLVTTHSAIPVSMRRGTRQPVALAGHADAVEQRTVALHRRRCADACESVGLYLLRPADIGPPDAMAHRPRVAKRRLYEIGTLSTEAVSAPLNEGRDRRSRRHLG